jgi:hypothetical protein
MKGSRPKVRLFITVDADVAEAVKANAKHGEISATCEEALKVRFGAQVKNPVGSGLGVQ